MTHKKRGGCAKELTLLEVVRFASKFKVTLQVKKIKIIFCAFDLITLCIYLQFFQDSDWVSLNSIYHCVFCFI